MDDTLTAGWSDFAVALAGAAAALAGLVMVAISVNIKEILALPGVTARAAAAVGSLVLVVVTAGLLLVPGQPAPVLGAELLVPAALAVLLHAVSLVKRMRQATVPRFTRGIPGPGCRAVPRKRPNGHFSTADVTIWPLSRESFR